MKVADWIKWPAWALASLVALGAMLAAFGFGVQTPGDKWDEHTIVHTEEEIVRDEQFTRIDNALIQMNYDYGEQKTMTEALIRGECLESMSDKIVLQGLSETCTDLGVERTAGDAIDRQLDGN